jgi:glycosyltransferase involved in cell wall biosynthesis
MDIRKIAVFHNMSQVGSAWGCAEGIVTTLVKLGYEVVNCGHPRATTASIEALKNVDLIILGAPEWYDHMLFERYGRPWLDLSTPKVAWYAETAQRDDRSFDFARCRALADLHYYPAIQDAEEFGGQWLPFGADTLMFSPMAIDKLYETAFLGSLYEKRREFIKAVTVPITVMAAVAAEDPVQSCLLLAKAYNATKIFVNMPSYSRLLVTKVVEVMACRTMLVTPALDHPSGLRNMLQFENGKHLVYYDQNKPNELAEILNYYLHHPAEREAIACAGWEEVNKRHTLQHRVEKILGDARLFIQNNGKNTHHRGTEAQRKNFDL